MTCCYLGVDQLDPDTFIISYLMLNMSIFIIIWDGSPPDLIHRSVYKITLFSFTKPY